MSLKSRVEAVLFLTDKPVVAAVVAKLVNEDVQLVRQAIMQLIFDYEQRDCALEIADDDDGYMMQVKDEYANLANDLAPIDLPVAVVRTLSAIAIKQPVMQSDIVRIRGAGAYEHIGTLLEKELITKKEEGRSPLLSTTKKFQEYFRLSQDAKALRNQLKDLDKEDKSEDHQQLDQQLELPLDQDVSGDTTSFIPGSQEGSTEESAAVESLTPVNAGDTDPLQTEAITNARTTADRFTEEEETATANHTSAQDISDSDISTPNNDQLMAAPGI